MVGEAAEVFGPPVGDVRIEAAGDFSEGALGFVIDELAFLLLGGGLGEEIVEFLNEEVLIFGWVGHGFCGDWKRARGWIEKEKPRKTGKDTKVLAEVSDQPRGWRGRGVPAACSFS